VLNPGNAGSNTAADHVMVLDEAISELPGDVQAGHHVGDDTSLVQREVVCRTDSGGSTAAFMAALRARNIRFFTSAMTTDQVQLHRAGGAPIRSPVLTLQLHSQSRLVKKASRQDKALS
jgi:hypothetical protein